jgi:membrane protein implicated in regulation of membrane protease activity
MEEHMKTMIRCKLLAVSLGLSLAGAAAAETIVIAEPQVRTIVTQAGYAEPVNIVREGELWRVRSVAPAGDEVTIFVDANGEVLGAANVARTRIVETTTVAPVPRVVAAPLTEADVTAVLVEAGFHNVHDVDRRGNVWKAEADDITGEDFEIHVDATTGMIVHIEDD